MRVGISIGMPIGMPMHLRASDFLEKMGGPPRFIPNSPGSRHQEIGFIMGVVALAVIIVILKRRGWRGCEMHPIRYSWVYRYSKIVSRYHTCSLVGNLQLVS